MDAHEVAGRLCFIVATGWLLLGSQTGPPRPPAPPGPRGLKPGHRLEDIRQKLDRAEAVDFTAQRALEFSRAFLGSAEKATQANQVFAADRLAEAADAMIHVAEHQLHLRTDIIPKQALSSQSVEDHLHRVYFQTQQADFFSQQSQDTRDRSFPKWARDFYQLAVRAYERNDLLAAEENAKSADDVVRALESLAQAATVPGSMPPAAKPPAPGGFL